MQKIEWRRACPEGVSGRMEELMFWWRSLNPYKGVWMWQPEKGLKLFKTGNWHDKRNAIGSCAWKACTSWIPNALAWWVMGFHFWNSKFSKYHFLSRTLPGTLAKLSNPWMSVSCHPSLLCVGFFLLSSYHSLTLYTFCLFILFMTQHSYQNVRQGLLSVLLTTIISAPRTLPCTWQALSNTCCMNEWIY